METDQEATAGDCPAAGQTPVKTRLSSSKRGPAAARTPASTTSRFQGDGVRYKAKLIGVDPVPEAEGDKMCLDSMMKLKGLEMASRSQGRHKQRVWLMVSTAGLRIVDERTGMVEHDHKTGMISSVRKDESDPRALAYIHHHQDTFMLFYIKMVNLADPVLEDIKEVCQSLGQEAQQEPVATTDQVNSTLLLLDENPVCQPKASSTDELMDIFPDGLEEPPEASQPGPVQQSLSISEMFSSYPGVPVGGSPYSPPTTMPWGQQGPMVNLPTSPNGQWMGPAPWPPQPGAGMTHWAPAGGVMPPGGPQVPAYGVPPQPGGVWGQNTAGCPPVVTNVGYPTSALAGGNGLLQPVSPTTAHPPTPDLDGLVWK